MPVNEPSTAAWYDAIAELEARLLAAWVSGPSFRAAWTPNPKDFARPRHQAIASACAAMAALGVEGDVWPALLDRLASTGDLTRLWQLGQTPLEAVRVDDPAADLARWRELRCLFALRSRLLETFSTLTPATDLATARKAILEAAAQAHVGGAAKTYSLGDGLSRAYQDATNRERAGAYSGYGEVDRATGGIRPGHVWVLGAPTNWGKSSWLLSVADRFLSTHGRGVILVTCEDAPELLFGRWLCRRANIRGGSMRDGKFASGELDAAIEAIRCAPNDAPVMLDGRGRSVELLGEDIRSLVSRHGASLVLVDYLQCIATDRETQDRRAEINHIARTLTDAIKTSGAAGVIASQLTGEDIRESRDVEHAAEVVLIGRKSEEGEMSLYVKKNKVGSSGFEISLDWDRNVGTFRNDEKEDEYGLAFADQ